MNIYIYILYVYTCAQTIRSMDEPIHFHTLSLSSPASRSSYQEKKKQIKKIKK